MLINDMFAGIHLLNTKAVQIIRIHTKINHTAGIFVFNNNTPLKQNS